MKYLVTGHTGFKGSWLSLLLSSMGHTVSGISLDPEDISLFRRAGLEDVFVDDIRMDIGDRNGLRDAVKKIAPEVIIHLAAQPLVRHSYKNPIETFQTNVLGSLNLLEATRGIENLKAILMITTDKVYKNLATQQNYSEESPLGGDDPYSASKAAADIAIQSWIKSFGEIPIAIARAGNVIGGGDWGTDRLIPDLVKAYANSSVPLVRHPNAVRPWQHVLDCLNGYLILMNAMLEEQVSGEWNFGPDHTSKYSVSEVIDVFGSHFGVIGDKWKFDEGLNPKESAFLMLNSHKARTQLGWGDVLEFDSALGWTAAWYKKEPMFGARATTQSQINDFLAITRQ